MRLMAPVDYWLNRDSGCLFVQDKRTKKVEVVKDGWQIALFLNEHNLTVDDAIGIRSGRDALGLFSKHPKYLLPTIGADK